MVICSEMYVHFCFNAFRMVRIYNKLHKAIWTIGWVLLRDWEWTHSNFDMLLSHMSPEDKKVRPLFFSFFVLQIFFATS